MVKIKKRSCSITIGGPFFFTHPVGKTVEVTYYDTFLVSFEFKLNIHKNMEIKGLLSITNTKLVPWITKWKNNASHQFHNYAPIFLCLILDLSELANYLQTEINLVWNETHIFIGLELEIILSFLKNITSIFLSFPHGRVWFRFDY